MRVLIVDDEPLAREGLSLRLQAYPEIRVVAECGDYQSALQAALRHDPDAAFLDIEMPGGNGLRLAAALSTERPIGLVFVTAYPHYALASFDQQPLDYIVKPVSQTAINRAVKRLQRFVLRSTGKPIHPPLVFREGDRRISLRVEEIERVEAAGDYMCIHAQSGVHVVRITLRTIARKLAPAGFVRVHRSALVDPARICSLRSLPGGDFEIDLHSGARLRGSRTYRQDVYARVQPG